MTRSCGGSERPRGRADLLLLLALAGCGRLGFDAVGSSGGGDGGPGGDGVVPFLDADIDELAVFDRALTAPPPDEIAAL